MNYGVKDFMSAVMKYCNPGPPMPATPFRAFPPPTKERPTVASRKKVNKKKMQIASRRRNR